MSKLNLSKDSAFIIESTKQKEIQTYKTAGIHYEENPKRSC
jgi:hypothetical protein